MNNGSFLHINQFFVIGISYKTATEQVRGAFSLCDDAISSIAEQSKEDSKFTHFIVSTCNRTEIYGFGDAEYFKQLYYKHISVSEEEFENHLIIKTGENALHHLLRVSTGLESQILGDFEIISQIKKGFKRSKKLGVNHGLLEYINNLAAKASKRIKTKTYISDGATSVAYAAVQYILKSHEDVENKRILLFGTGKIGANTCENLTKQLPNASIHLINRTNEKALKLAHKFALEAHDFSDINHQMNLADIIIVATGHNQFTVHQDMFEKTSKAKTIIDLSIPHNVAHEVKEIPNFTVVSTDFLSQMISETMAFRESQIPKAESIIETILKEILIWQDNRKNVSTFINLKDWLFSKSHIELLQIANSELDTKAKLNLNKGKYDNTQLKNKLFTVLSGRIKEEKIHIEQLKAKYEPNPKSVQI